MIYLLYGSDTEKARAKLHELVASLVKKKPDASHVIMSDEFFSENLLEEYLGGSGLFSQKMIVEALNVFRNKDAKEIVVKKLKEVKESENVFVFLEGELDKKALEKFEKNSEKIQEFAEVQPSKAKVEPRLSFNIFALTDAFGRRDRKNLWVLYTKAKMEEKADEEIHGILFWQAKSMLLASKSKNASESGLKPFVYEKSRQMASNFKDGELEKISMKLVSMYHDAHRGLCDFSDSLEKFILEL